MESSNQYHAIPIGEQQNAFQSSSPMKSIRSFSNGGLVQVMGLVVLVALTAFVSAQVTATRIESRGIPAAMPAVGKAFAAPITSSPQKPIGIPNVMNENFKSIVRGYVDDICGSITWTACTSYSVRDTEWCKICISYMS